MSDLGKVMMTPKKEFVEGVSYERLDVVTYGGSGYVARKNTTGQLPTDEEYWQLVAEKGEQGDIGKQGPPPTIGPNGNWFSGDVDTGVKAQIMTDRQTLTIPAAGWTETGGYGEFARKNVVQLEDVTVNDILSGQVTMETEVYAQNAHLSFQNQTANGTVTFYAERIPEGDIEVVYSLLKGMGV